MFTDRLQIAVELTIDTEVVKIPGGDVRACELELRPWGFTGRVCFEVLVEPQGEPDALLPLFTTQDLIKARVSVQSAAPDLTEESTPLIVRGLVTDKTLRETVYKTVTGAPPLRREYTIDIEDAAAVLFRQHFPLTVQADTTVGEVIDKQSVDGVTLDVDLDAANVGQNVVCLGLGEGEASFYDFLWWYAAGESGGLLFDYESFEHSLTASKPRVSKTANLRVGAHLDLEGFRVVFPPIQRRGARVLNSYTENAKTVEIEQDQAVTGVQGDVLVRTAIASDVDTRKTAETKRLRQREPELHVTYARFPRDACWPGAGAEFERGFVSAGLYRVNKKYRVAELSMRAHSADADMKDDRGMPVRGYEAEVKAVWEDQRDKVFRAPSYGVPNLRLQVEGKLVADGGDETDRIYMVFEDKDTSQSFYKVHVPLWNQKFRVPFQPHFLPGHFYAPAFKNSRVLLDVEFLGASIAEFLDWGADVAVPSDTQGNHLLFGKNATSETSLKHVYKDEKPVFSVNRVFDGDVQIFQMEEGRIVLEAKEDPKKKAKSSSVDLSPNVGVAKEQVASGTQAAIGALTGAFTNAKGGVMGKLEEAQGAASAALDEMEEALAGQVGAARAAMDSALSGLSQQSSALEGGAASAIAELKANLSL